MHIKVRVGQPDAIKILASAGGGSVSAVTAQNVIGGIASVTQLSVSGISTLSGGLNLTGGLSLDNLVVTGITTSASFIGPLTGNVTGNLIGNVTGNLTGTASTATTALGLSGIPNITVSALNASSLSVSGLSTLTGIVTTTNDLYVGGDLYVGDDIVLDSLTGNSLNITGIATVNSLNVPTNVTIGGNLSVGGTLTYEDCLLYTSPSPRDS